MSQTNPATSPLGKRKTRPPSSASGAEVPSNRYPALQRPISPGSASISSEPIARTSLSQPLSGFQFPFSHSHCASSIPAQLHAQDYMHASADTHPNRIYPPSNDPFSRIARPLSTLPPNQQQAHTATDNPPGMSSSPYSLGPGHSSSYSRRPLSITPSRSRTPSIEPSGLVVSAMALPNNSPMSSRARASSRQPMAMTFGAVDMQPRPLSSSANTANTVKAISDRMKSLEDSLRHLQTTGNLNTTDIGKLAKQCRETSLDLAELRRTTNELYAFYQGSRETEELTRQELTSLRCEMNEIRAYIAAGGDGSAMSASGSAASVSGGVVRTREPMINGLIRAVMRTLMGTVISSNETTPHLPDGRVWTSDDPLDHSRRLRPIWSAWLPNEISWRDEVVEKAKNQGKQLYMVPRGVDAEQFFASLTVVELQNATQTYWTSLHHKWLKDCKSAQEKEKLAGEARVKQRRVTKVKARIQNRDKVPEIAGPDYNWMFLAKYQSDEYSAAEDDSPTRGNNNRLSPDSDDPQASQAVAGRIRNTGSKKKPSSQPWVRRQPTYRTQEVVDMHTSWANQSTFRCQSEVEQTRQIALIVLTLMLLG
ncbi:hypothetical protein BC835DRAFT_1305624 [Cytidiella melzeri]|nr:hypothetical protein BC835DRAFT_1305624 [Cytidiella melzeri]